jgi:hypothetical protein
MAQRQHLHAGANLEPRCARGDRGSDGQRRAQHGTRGLLMDLRQPDRVQPPAFGLQHLLERLGESLRVRLLLHLTVEFVVPAELHANQRGIWSRRAQRGPRSRARERSIVAHLLRRIEVWRGRSSSIPTSTAGTAQAAQPAVYPPLMRSISENTEGHKTAPI